MDPLSNAEAALHEKFLSSSPYIQCIIQIVVTNASDKTDYHKEIINRLIDVNIKSEDAINKILFYFNYNDEGFVSYLYEKLSALSESLPTKKQKISALCLEKKKYNQYPSRVNCCLNDNMLSLKEQVNLWIEEEFKFLQYQYLPGAGELFTPANEHTYLHVPFKSSEIYLLHKSFVDAGGALGETYKSLFEKTGPHLSNKNQKGFSIESLQKCSDKVDYESTENVKRFLMKMIRNIDSY